MCFNWLKNKPEAYIQKMRGLGIVEVRKTLRDFFENGVNKV
jgi:hypothetical protein